ncbi:hypothetical protein BO94DRAFT_617132 [Aspergillus sclerotioniger CBS 115572]|uniref:Uncharacterized protein n=1 Tax=Aspergillus sclerotioniger CBS 115572 TaxID=1450535 RepID=A0A317X2D3_9EURO|nr:hypothetical protein BO94DRAFT_617132 [Aspergillus sclerotioniger CBS 115572]PWY91772.1 hypothetical protein BO94DRAFT_617132 [Aspergillus sclerotioniger CBS 115572]
MTPQTAASSPNPMSSKEANTSTTMNQPNPQPSETTPPVKGTINPTIPNETNSTNATNPDRRSSSDNSTTEGSVPVIGNDQDQFGSIDNVDELLPSLSLEDPPTEAEENVLPEITVEQWYYPHSDFDERSLQLD